jgi:alpha-beta hydrolase superfamily lysophospholipase
MNLSFISLLSNDKLKLPGLLYTPDRPTKKAAVWLHGMGDSGAFYNPERINALGKSLTEHGIALLAFNNRGAHASKSLLIMDETLPEEERRYQAGTHYEKIIDSVYDIDGAASYLKGQGYTELYLMGHSTGANKICVYDAHAKHNPFKRYVLAGPGDDTGLFYSELGPSKFKKALAYAKQALREGDTDRVMPIYTGMNPFSVQAAADILDADGDYNTFPLYEATKKRLGTKPLFAEYSKIIKSLLVVYGEEDEYTYTCGGTEVALAILRRFTNEKALPLSDFVALPGTDHGFHGAEELFAKTVAAWLAK